jgi:hypothetical protein
MGSFFTRTKPPHISGNYLSDVIKKIELFEPKCRIVLVAMKEDDEFTFKETQKDTYVITYEVVSTRVTGIYRA